MSMSPKEESALLTSFELHSKALSTSDDERTRHQGLMGLMVVRILTEAVFVKDLERWCDERRKHCVTTVAPNTVYGKIFAMRNQLVIVMVALILKGLGPQLLDLLSKVIPTV